MVRIENEHSQESLCDSSFFTNDSKLFDIKHSWLSKKS